MASPMSTRARSRQLRNRGGRWLDAGCSAEISGGTGRLVVARPPVIVARGCPRRQVGCSILGYACDVPTVGVRHRARPLPRAGRSHAGRRNRGATRPRRGHGSSGRCAAPCSDSSGCNQFGVEAGSDEGGSRAPGQFVAVSINAEGDVGARVSGRCTCRTRAAASRGTHCRPPSTPRCRSTAPGPGARTMKDRGSSRCRH